MCNILATAYEYQLDYVIWQALIFENKKENKMTRKTCKMLQNDRLACCLHIKLKTHQNGNHIN